MSRRQAEPASMTTTTTINAEHPELAETAELLCTGLFALTLPSHLAHVLFCGLGVLRGSMSANITKSRVSTEQPYASACSASSAPSARSALIEMLRRNSRHLPCPERLQELSYGVEVESPIVRLDAQKEAVPAGEGEARHVEHRVIGHWQAVERQHAQNRRQRGRQDRAFEGDGNERRPAVKRLSADVDRICRRGHPVLQQVPAKAAAQPADQHNQRQPGMVGAERFVQLLDRVR